MTVDKLIDKIMVQGEQPNEYWLKLEEEVDTFLESSASEAEKDRLRNLGPTEMLAMICNGIRWERNK